MTVSIGLATRAPGVEPLGDLMERADQALYRAKAGGRDRVVVAAAVALLRPAGGASPAPAGALAQGAERRLSPVAEGRSVRHPQGPPDG